MNHKCYFCKNNVVEVDFKEVKSLRRFMTNWSRIKPATNTGLCTKHQRQLSRAIKRARYLAMIPYVTR